MLLYSAKKKSANVIDEYSTLNPATSSASASGKSKGVRFVSAIADIKKITANGKSGQTNQTCFCILTISIKLKDAAHIITGKIPKIRDTSYEIICEVERNAPKKAYRELLAHPAKIIP